MSQTTPDLLDIPSRTVELTESERHRLLEADRRRHALAVLSEHRQPLDLAEMATAVAVREPGLDENDRSAVSQVATSLHHVHVPILAEAGVVEYDPETNRITP